MPKVKSITGLTNWYIMQSYRMEITNAHVTIFEFKGHRGSIRWFLLSNRILGCVATSTAVSQCLSLEALIYILLKCIRTKLFSNYRNFLFQMLYKAYSFNTVGHSPQQSYKKYLQQYLFFWSGSQYSINALRQWMIKTTVVAKNIKTKFFSVPKL